jgi:hypothetical protein
VRRRHDKGDDVTAISARRSRQVRVLLVVAACLALMTACGPLKAGAAAVVGDNSLSESTVADMANEVNTTIAAGGGQSTLSAADLNQRLVSLWVDEQVTKVLADQMGITVTQGEIDQFLARFDSKTRLQIVSQGGIPPSAFNGAAEITLLRSKIATQLLPNGSQDDQQVALSKALVKAAADADVSVNPRFGVWNPTIPGVDPRSDDRLSSPGNPTPSPSPSLQPTG